LKYRLFSIAAALFFLLVSPCFTAAAAAPLAEKYKGEGFSFSLPANYRPDEPPSGDGTFFAFSSPYSTLKVFVQELSSRVRAETYIEYSNRQLYLGKAGFSLRQKQNKTVNGYRTTALVYSRPPLASLGNDRNYYREVHVTGKRKNMVVTFWAKASQDYYLLLEKDLELAVQSFLESTKPLPGKAPARTALVSPHIRYTGKKVTLEIPPGEVVWGRFCPGVPFNADSYDRMLDSEVRLNHKFEFLMTYCRFPDNKPFPAEAIENVYRDGRVLMLTLQPFDGKTDWVAIPEIIDGKYDAIIKEWAEGLKKIGEPVFIRPLNEMNGDWDPWCAWFYGKDTDLYVLAWRHIVDIFKETGTSNALFVWNPHDRSYPDFEWNDPQRYYSGRRLCRLDRPDRLQQRNKPSCGYLA
jgi:hypothetical protein